MEILGKIFGSPARVKIMRLFLLNPGKHFRNRDIVKRSRVDSSIVSRELKLLASINFIKNKDSRADLLIVGDRMKRSKIEEGVRKLEAEIGTELVYAIFDTKEFIYRLNMYDKLVRDILDFPHEVVLQAKELNLAKITRYA